MSEAAKPRLLFLSSVFPDVTGSGVAMRAGLFLQALSKVCDVYLIVLPVFAGGGESSLELIERTCRDWALAQPMPGGGGGLRARMRDALTPRPMLLRFVHDQAGLVESVFADQRFDVLHVFRLTMWPIAEAILNRPGPRPQVHLDLDDIESEKVRATAALNQLNGHDGTARLEAREAERYAVVERNAIALVDRIYVCSQPDRQLLTALYGIKRVEVIPNAVALPEAVAELDGFQDVFRLLFVGTLGYYPNDDGVLFFCNEVLPLIRERASRPVQLTVVGRGESKALDALSDRAGVKIVGAVDDISESYANTDAVVVPIRAGGGTRIKALEAFAHRRPVVTTSIGIYGIEVQHGRHVLIADTPEDFASACLRLIDEPALSTGLVENALRLVSERYSLDVVSAQIRSLFAPPH